MVSGSWILKRCRPVVVDGLNSSHWWIDHWRIGRNDGSHVNLANGGKIRCLAGRGNGIAALPRWETLVGKNEEEYWFKTETGSKLLLVVVSRKGWSYGRCTQFISNENTTDMSDARYLFPCCHDWDRVVLSSLSILDTVQHQSCCLAGGWLFPTVQPLSLQSQSYKPVGILSLFPWQIFRWANL